MWGESMRGKVKNQHYVPRMYLSRFSADGKRICVWNLMKDDILTRQQPANYAAKRYFYDTSEQELKKALNELAQLYPDSVENIDFSDEQFLEKALSRVEADAANIMDLISEKSEELYNEVNMQKMIIFLHELAYRSEKYRSSMENTREQLLASLRRLGISPEQVEGMEDSPKDNQLYQLMGIAPLLKTAKMLTEHYNWYIGTVKGPMKLLISDNPMQGIVLGFNDICVPLSGDKAIIFRIADPNSPILSKDMPNGNEIELTHRSVFAYNAVQLSYANRFVFGDKFSLAMLKLITDRQGGYVKVFGEKPVLREVF